MQSNKKYKPIAVKSNGQTFKNKKKLNKADFTFKNENGKSLIKMPGDINGIEFMIKDL